MQFLLRVLRRAWVAVVGLGLLFLVGWLGGWWFWIVFTALAIVALSEYYSALQTRGIRPNVFLGWFCSIVILLATQLDSGSHSLMGQVEPVNALGSTANAMQYITLILFFCVAGTLVCQFSRKPDQSAVVNSATTVFGVAYIGLMISFIIRMRFVDIPWLTGTEAGELASRMGGVLLGSVPTWMCDTAAFFVGNLAGRTKLAPLVSPGKTVEGAVAGFAFAVIGAIALGTWWMGMPLVHSLVLGAILGIVGQVGDLAKSVLKRDMGIKDFGSLFGEHGGMLDRFDAVMFNMPIIYWYCWFFLSSGGAG